MRKLTVTPQEKLTKALDILWMYNQEVKFELCQLSVNVVKKVY